MRETRFAAPFYFPLKMAEKRIEIFPGSLRDLEYMTGNSYEAVKDGEGFLVKLTLDTPVKYIHMALEKIAEDNQYDGFVHVQYAPSYLSQSGEILFDTLAYPIKLIRT